MALRRGQKVKYHLISITKSVSKIFIPNFVCVFTNERYKTYQTGVLFCRLGHALGVGLGVHRGQNQIPSCCLSVMLSPPKPLDEIQPNLVCELLTWMGPTTEGVKRSNIIKFQLQSQFHFQSLLFQTLCVFSQIEDTKHIRQFLEKSINVHVEKMFSIW